MKQQNEDALGRLYESLKLLCYQLPHFISDFDNEFTKKSETEKLVFNKVQEELKSCMADVFNNAELVYNILNSDDEAELRSLVEPTNTDGAKWKDG
jgi:hypothetical protein